MNRIKIYRIPALALMMLICGGKLQAQVMLNMDRALDIAIQNSPIMQQVELDLISNQERLNAQRARLKSRFGLALDPFQYQRTNSFDQRTSEWYLNESARSSGTFSINQRILPTDGTLSLQNRFWYDYNNSQSQGAINPISRTWNNQFSIALTQPIFTYNRTKVELERVELSYESSLLRYLLQKLNLERNVARSFYSVYSRQMSLDIANEEFMNNTDSHEIIKNKVEGGLLAVEELYQSEVNLATSRSSVYTAELNLANAMDELKVIIGMPLTDEFEIVTIIQADSVDVDQTMAINHALKNRMELRQREISIQNSMFNLLNAKTVNEFAGSLTASFGITANHEQLDQLFDNPTNTPAVGLTLNIPIFDWGERKSEIKAAEANLQNTEIDLDIEKIDIQVNIRAIIRNLQNLENQIVIQQKTVKNAILTYDINLERYRNGDLTSLDLGIYQNQLSDRKMSLTNAIIDYKLELLNLKIQTLYDFENNINIIPEELLADEETE
ncbi:MAG TPA: TolC family protein [Bacteroides sp.]|nr:TolC family protein [Bacteroides sp.]